MQDFTPPLECVAFMLICDNRLLVEQRSMNKRVVPGVKAIPGGHLEPGEDPEAGVRRELLEELAVVPHQLHYVCTLLHHAEEFRKLHYFAVTAWTGKIQAHEAESLRWLPLTALVELDLQVDHVAVQEYMRLYHG